jgi:hypothetical protein
MIFAFQKARTFFILMVYCMLSNCTDNGIDVPDAFVDPLEGLADEGTISLKDPAIGQRSLYLFYEASYTASTGNVAFNYEADTLVIAITGKEFEKWILKEFLTAGSNSRLNRKNSSWGPLADSIFVSHLFLKEDSIHIARPSGYSLPTFTFRAEQKLPYHIASDAFPENQGGLPRFEISPLLWLEYVNDFSRPGKTYDRLNVYFDYRDMETDGLGYMNIYGQADGLVRSAWISPWLLDKASGWDIIPR